MKFSFKSIAAAVTLAVAAVGAHAAQIDIGNNGNGDMFFSIWDTTSATSGGKGSYTLNLGTSLDSFSSTLANTGSLDLSWAADATLNDWMASITNKTTLRWNVVGLDSFDDNRIFTTVNTVPTGAKGDDVTRNAVAEVQNYLANKVNPSLASADSAVFGRSTAGYAGSATANPGFGNNIGANFSGTAAQGGFTNDGKFQVTSGVANNSFESGLKFMSVNAASSGTEASVYSLFNDGTTTGNPLDNSVRVWFDASNTLHMAAAAAPVPEPTETAMLLAGLGMIGFMARRRQNRK